MQKLLLPMILLLLLSSLGLQGIFAASFQLLAFAGCCYWVLSRKRQPSK